MAGNTERSFVIGKNEYRSTTVCVDSYENHVFSGRFYNPFYPDGRKFRSLTEFLREMENMMDEMVFPQSFSNRRSFWDSDARCLDTAQSDPVQVGVRGTFIVRVLFRQNTSWQGTVHWKEGKLESSFRSVLELVLLFDDALNMENNEGDVS